MAAKGLPALQRAQINAGGLAGTRQSGAGGVRRPNVTGQRLTDLRGQSFALTGVEDRRDFF